jgi:dipeptidyl aminopeptidase/acylaminoacyl peptidase
LGHQELSLGFKREGIEMKWETLARAFGGALVLVAALWAPAASVAQTLTAKALFEPPVVSGAAISPDGTRVIFREQKPGDDKSTLVLVDLNTKTAKALINLDDTQLRELVWLNNQRLLIVLTSEWGWPKMVALNADGSQVRELVGDAWSASGSEDDSKVLNNWLAQIVHISRESQTPFVWIARPEAISKERVGHTTLWKINALSGRRERLDVPLDSTRWIFNTSNELAAVLNSRAETETIQVRKGSQWETVHTQNVLSPDAITPMLSLSDTELLVTARAGGDKRAIYAFNTETKKLAAQPLFRSDEFDLDALPVVRGGKLKGFHFIADTWVTQWTDAAAAKTQERIDQLLPNTANIVHLPADASAKNVGVFAYSDRDPGTSYTYNTDTGRLTRLGEAKPAIASAQMASSEFVRYPARDGLSVPAYLTLPKGANKKNLPLVVLVHGGPYLRGADWSFDPQVQFLASRGYAVLQPEFRGSTGFGFKHFQGGWKQWGQAMQDDLEDAVKWAVAQGHADAKRVCIAGASYGGYAAMMGLVRHPDTFKCAINWVGVSDIEMLYTVRWSDASDEWKRYGMPKLVGDLQADQAMLRANSPLRRAAEIKAPVLIAHGGKDERVPIIHAERLRDALKTAGNTQVDWVVYAQEAHGWSKLETNIDFWTRVEKFLAQHIGARAAN